MVAIELDKVVPALAPDGLPWPEGYFDRPPRVTFEETVAQHGGVRPSRYWKGFPVYTFEDRSNPNFVSVLPIEDAEWIKELESTDAGITSDATL